MAGALRERVEYVHASDGSRLALTELSADGDQAASHRALPPPPCFLLIHGFAQNRHAFIGSFSRALLDRGARVLIGELRGHGRSEHAPEARSWSLATLLVEDLPALIGRAKQVTECERIHLVGHSMGGMLGYAVLGRSKSLASLTTFASPVIPARDRWLLRMAASITRPVLRLGRPRAIPMDHLLRALAPLLSAPNARGGVRLFQRIARLANPQGADPELLQKIFASADPESPTVFAELADMVLTGRASIDGIDLADAVRSSPIPVAAIIAANDLFASRTSVDAVEPAGAAGPRLILEVPDASHVDLTVGPHAPGLVAKLWAFLLGA